MQIRLFNNIRSFVLRTDKKTAASLYERKKSILLSFFLYFFLAVSLFFIIVAIVNSNYAFIPADATFFVLGLAMFYFLNVKNYLRQTILVFVIMICAISTLFVLTGGMNETGIITAVLIPIPVILLLGKKKGMWTIVAFSVINVLSFLLLQDESWFPNYDSSWIERVIIVYIIITLMAYANEYIFDQLYSKLETITNSFRTSQERYKNLAINKEKILSLISHDLSHHIGNFAVTSKILHDQFEIIPDDEKKKLINQLTTVSNQNYHLLHDLLNWSTVSNETIPYVPGPIRLEGILREVIELFDSTISDKKLSLFIKVKSNAEVFADSDLLGSIMRNLLSNAIKFSEKNGEVQISTIEKDEFMLISFKDNGIGMSPIEIQQIESSVSFTNPGTEDEPGTGIGLILVKEFVQKNKGELFIESVPGKGSEVSFTLPLA